MDSTTIQRPTPPATEPREPQGQPRGFKLIVAAVAISVALIAAGAFGLARDDGDTPATSPVVDARVGGPTGRIGAGSIAETVAQLEARVEEFPNDDVALATLGLAYVELARITADTSLYERADVVLASSLAVDEGANFVARAGLAAVAAARHDFRTAEREALAGLDINPANATLWGVLSDAQIQLGEYDDGFASVQRMGELVPDIASITRAAYVAELTGDVDEARRLMERALDDAFSSDDRAFALVQIGEIEMVAGRPNEALGYFLDALEASPDDISALAGKAHALGQTGQTETAITNYELLLERAPLADFMIEFGEFLDGHDRSAEAESWYQQAREQIVIDLSNGVRPDAALIFFETDHGDPVVALDEAEAAVATRPFFELHEAHGWALYRNERYEDADLAMAQAAEIGVRDSAMFVRWALIKHALGDEAAATELWTDSLSINPLGRPYLTTADEAVVAGLAPDM